MSSTLPSDEVAEDYKNALEDLVSNDRYQIANLTMIAKENIEHAEAISRVLTNHINRVSPTRKLPALYVLDSLVKNIGSPYTVYFGRNLHQTYMHAYSQVDSMVRKKLEEMLKTWREPVPGSLSTTSVFPISSTQTIVDALNRFRASTAPASQRQTPAPGFRPPHMQVPQTYRNTPTPPQVPASYNQYSVNPHGETPTPQPPPNYNPYPQSQTPVYPPVSTPQWQASTPQPQHSYPVQLPQRPPSRSSVDLPKLHADIDDLTTDAKIECATHPMDSAAQRKLTTLQTLKEILDSGSASEQDLIDIRNTIMQEMAKKVTSTHQAPTQTPVLQPSQISYMPPQPPQPTYQQPPPPPPPPPPAPIPSFINSTNLAELLRMTAQSTPQPQQAYPAVYPPVQTYSTPPIVHAIPAPTHAPIQPPPPVIPASALPLLEQLRASGLLSATPTPPQGVGTSSGIAGLLSQSTTIDIQFTTASIKIARPQLLTTFLNARPNQCSTCGKRFTSDDAGREKKARHLDWHFKTKARMIEAEKRGQNRSWYVDEREWIASKEFEDDVGLNEDQNIANGTSPNAKKKQQDYVRAPTDPVLRTAPCPIDQEPFKSEWSEEVQDFIWKDAIKVGNRYYHASCYREATKDRDKDTGGATPLGAGTTRTATPDSVLGKRKAEREMEETAKSRIKLEV